MTAALIYLAILVVAFFFLIVLPQRRRMAAHRALVDAMDVGDEIVTTAGIHGTVREIREATLRLEIAPGVVVTMARGAVSQRSRPTEAAPSATPDVELSGTDLPATALPGTGDPGSADDAAALDGPAVERRPAD